MMIFKKYNHWRSSDNYSFSLIPTIELEKVTIKHQTHWTINNSILIHFLNLSFRINIRKTTVVSPYVQMPDGKTYMRQMIKNKFLEEIKLNKKR